MRARSDLWELRTDDLGFAAADATILLNGVLKLDLAPEDIAVLSERTEGWAAGLYLVALSLMGRADTHAFIKDFAGDNRHIVDYLSAEVLDGSDLRWFLVCSSNLNKLSGPLCDAVLEISDSEATLERIERENLFLVPLDSARRWYRYHHLFSELLRSELRRTEPDAIRPLGYLALISVEQGRWAEAAQLVDQVSGEPGNHATDHFVDMMLCEAVAKILDQRGDTDAAFHNADTAVRLARRGGGLFELAGALITRAELAGRLSDADAARAGLTEAREVLQRSADRDLAR
jgi:hypothetical protein